MNIKIKPATLLNITFAMFYLSNILFAYSTISRLCLIIFVASTIPLWLKKNINPFFIAYIIFILWNIYCVYGGHAINSEVAKDMIGTLVLNAGFIFAFSHYIAFLDSPQSFFFIYKKLAVFVSLLALALGAVGGFSGERLGGFLNANVVGMTAAYALVVQIYELFTDKKMRNKALPYFITLLLLLVIMLTASRKALLIPIIAIYVMVCCNKPRKFLVYTLTTIISVAALLWLLLNVDFLYSVVGHRVESVILLLQGEEFDEGSLISRADYIALAWDYAKKNLTFGYGLDCFRMLPGAFSTYSHNNFLEILFSCGLVGFVIYYIPFVLALLCIPKALKKNRHAVMLLISVLVPFTVCDYFNVTYFERGWLIFPIATIMCMKRIIKSENSEADKKSV